MEETIIIPSPNWFHVSIMGASQDGWLVYGGPSKSLCFLEPLPVESIGTIDSKLRFRAHVFHRAHKEKISSVDISPEWPEKKAVITGGHDGVVKEWSIEPKDRTWIINYLHCQEEHSVQNEEVVGVCYGTKTIAVSVGSGGSLCKWDLNTNVVKRYATHLKSFKPTCISSSPHKDLHVAVGTRQGVIFVIDISGIGGKLVYKVRGQDDEINQVSWCPQYAVTANKIFNKEKKSKESFSASSRMDRIRNDLEPSEALEIAIAERSSTKEKHDSKENEDSKQEEEVIIPEDDMFDVYKDHEANEFGHKKYEPEDIYVTVKQEDKDDFLAECEKLKEEILKKKNESEESIESLVEALDKAHVEDPGDVGIEEISTPETPGVLQETQETQEGQVSSEGPPDNHEYRHLLASIGKYGGVRIWTQTGKLLASCVVLYFNKKDQKDHKNRGTNWPTLHWYKAESLLVADGKNQLLAINPLKIDGKNKLQWRVVHSLHRRGMYAVLSNAPRVQIPDLADKSSDWVVWTIGQDRNVISYNLKEDKKIEIFASCGAFIYEVRPCAYDAGKVAMTAGDGSIRVWETHCGELEDQLLSGVLTSYWQNVQGKILTLAWHPTKENLLAFGTAESRVGILDAGHSCEKPARNFPNSFKQGVYSLSWGENMDLYACGNGEMVLFRANKMDQKGRHIPVEVEGQVWEICEAVFTKHGLTVGATNGGVAQLDSTDLHVITATFVFLKMIYTIVWHPQQTTNSQEESKYKNYIAMCSIDKVNAIAILEYDEGEGGPQFKKAVEPLVGHEGTVLQVAWNPHRDAQLLSASQDSTVRIWNVLEGECVSIFGGHSMSVQTAMWCGWPRLQNLVLSGGGDCCLRLWDARDYPADSFTSTRKDLPKKKKLTKRVKEAEKRRAMKRENQKNVVEGELATTDPTQSENTEKIDKKPRASISENVATTVELTLKGSKMFLLPITARQVGKRSMLELRPVLTKHLAGTEAEGVELSNLLKTSASKEKGLGFLKMFGTMNELNELLDTEAESHLGNKNWESYLMLMFYRGRVDEMIQFASAHDLLDPYLLSLTPTVSFKYWKDTTQLYLAQLDRLAARGHEDRGSGNRLYGGVIFRKATALLSLHDLKGCLEVLLESNLFKEAYILCRLRHMDSIAEEVQQKWAETTSRAGLLMMAATIYMVRGDISEAAITLGRSNQINILRLAFQLAKLAGHNTFAAHIEEIVKTKECQEPETEKLVNLPSRVEALLRAGEVDSDDESDEGSNIVNGNGDVKDSSVINGTSAANGKVTVDSANAASAEELED